MVIVTKEKPILRLKRPRSTERPTLRARAPRVRGRRVVPLVKRATEEDLLADLQALAPAVWDPEKPAPLAVGIHTQINPVAERRRLSRRAVRRFLRRWTSGAAYLNALLEPDAQRVNVDGTPAEPVLERHRERAQQRLARRQPECGNAAIHRPPQQEPSQRGAR